MRALRSYCVDSNMPAVVFMVWTREEKELLYYITRSPKNNAVLIMIGFIWVLTKFDDSEKK